MTHPIMIGKRRDPNAPRPPLRERIAALRLVPRLIRLVWETQPTYTVLMILLRLTRSVVPVTNLWVAKLIIDEVVLLARTHGPTQHLWALVAIEMGAIVVGELLARTSGMIEGLLGDMFTKTASNHGARRNARPPSVRGSSSTITRAGQQGRRPHSTSRTIARHGAERVDARL
jgi:hypothetical protein